MEVNGRRNGDLLRSAEREFDVFVTMDRNLRARAQARDLLHERHPEAWSELEHLIEARSYDKTVALAVDLRDLAQRDDSLPEFEACFAVLKKAHARRRGFFDAFKRRVPL